MARSLLLRVFLLATLVVVSMATMAEDEKDCADQLQNLAVCIPYVSGSAKKPTPECCADTEKVRKAQPKCLCVLIKESTDPSMGLPVNTTLALQMPKACNSDARVADCPSILKLAPGSPDANIFKDPSEDSTATTKTSSSSASTGSDSDVGLSSKGTQKSQGKKLESFVGGCGVLLCLVATTGLLLT